MAGRQECRPSQLGRGRRRHGGQYPAGRGVYWGMRVHLLLLSALLLSATPGPSAGPDELTVLMRQLRRAPANPAPLAELKGLIGRIKDPDQQADALAVYCLGQLANENTAEALKAREALATRHADSAHLMLIRFDQLDRHCRLCNGTGQKRLAACPKCSGSRRCLVCGGRGQKTMANHRKIDCTACNASGRCPDCGGTGRKQEACPECKGRGSVLDQRKIRQVSQAISHGYLKRHDPAGDTPPSGEDEAPAELRRRSREFPEP